MKGSETDGTFLRLPKSNFLYFYGLLKHSEHWGRKHPEKPQGIVLHAWALNTSQTQLEV